MNFFKLIIFQFFYFFILRNKIYYLFSFIIKKKNNTLKKNLYKLKNDYENESLKDIAVTTSNLNLNNVNNLLLTLSLMNYFKGIGLKPLIFNTYHYKSLFKKSNLLAFKHLVYYADISFSKVRKISNQIINKNYDEILKFKYNGVACGKYAISTSMRMLRLAKVDHKNDKHKNCILYNLRKSILYANASVNFIKKNKVRYSLFNDRGYVGEGELYDVCIINNIKCIQYIATYKNGLFLIKKFSNKNKNDHPSSISQYYWKKFYNKKLQKIQSEKLMNEIKKSYIDKTWYPSAGTMVGKELTSAKQIMNQIGIKNDRKIAVIFPHIFWDGTFFYGNDLYENYEEWFKKTLIIAQKNKKINWIIKSHPSNVVKNIQDKISNKIIEPELKIIIELFGKIPNNFYYLSAKSNINTFYLFNILNFCITVRGTVAMETAMKNKIAITAGTGRYDNKKFTYNFNNKKKYEKALKSLPKFSITYSQQEINAKKFAYASLMCKNFKPSNIDFYYEPTLHSALKASLIERKKRIKKNLQEDELYLQWLNNDEEDFFFDRNNIWKFKKN